MIVQAWPTLPAAIRAGILAMIEAAGPRLNKKPAKPLRGRSQAGE
jgi:hypothetical protein